MTDIGEAKNKSTEVVVHGWCFILQGRIVLGYYS